MTKANSGAAIAPLVIDSKNLSEAWARIFIHILDHPGTEIAPLVLSIGDLDQQEIIEEDAELRDALDTLLRKKNKTSIENVAFTIFPERYWKIASGDRTKLFNLYKNTFGRIQARDRKSNGRGLYFQRMMMYGRGPCSGNQLEWILSQFQRRKGVRRSMFQATVFDAESDHTSTALIGFPCLQHVSFEPTKAGLVMNAFYATQQIFDKAYGNYLGLVQLGKFMASEMGMPLARVNVMVGVAKFERITKSDPALEAVIKSSRSLIETGQNIRNQAA
ncbi:thymidylate synthase [Rhizobiales bacterium]|uniref:thymidylate synthase n=1 Tax=Hongsoonwoonella zoysiae TaxID=2821844 RepID=UPI00155FC11A|nr:thymidylate synthase [Hongsoonwoonella zoysiae]NRG16905.1 thymidylate synthase [Hongsoonwoonella zoysiae]